MPLSKQQRWFRYGLRTLLSALTLLVLLVAYITIGAKSQRNAVAIVNALGGSVQYDFQRSAQINRNQPTTSTLVPQRLVDWLGVDYFHSIVTVSFEKADELTPGSFSVLSRFRDLQGLHVENCEAFSDRELEYLSETTEMTWLSLSATKVTGSGFQHLTKNSRIREIDLTDCPVDDRGVAQLAAFKKLDWLSLKGTHITDSGLRSIAGLSELDYLDLIGVSTVTNAGVAALAPLSRLTVLDLRRTSVDSGIAEHVTRLTSLRELLVSRISREAEDYIRQSLRGCSVSHTHPH